MILCTTNKYYSISPYAYCGNNPMKYVDRDGMVFGLFIDGGGQFVGDDGIYDGRMYVIKTQEKKFMNEKDEISGAGLSKKTIQSTIDFIKKNSGNSIAFKNNPIAYKNSIEIDGSVTNRQAMVTEVSRDNGRGGTSPENNREYGGSILNGLVEVATPGAAVTPGIAKEASITLHSGVSTFHSHPSGRSSSEVSSGLIRQSPPISEFMQPPSLQDVNTSGSFTHYVFGRGDKKVYIFNINGVQATLPMKYFVTPKPLKK